MTTSIQGGSSPYTGQGNFEAPAAAVPALIVRSNGPTQDTNGVSVIEVRRSDGTIGAFINALGTLQSYDGVQIFLSLVGITDPTTRDPFYYQVVEEPNPRLWIDAAGVIRFGTGATAEDVGLQRASPGVLQATAGGYEVPGEGAFATMVKAGIPSDADFPSAPPDGTQVLDTTDSRVYFRTGGAWKYAALT